MRAAKTIASLEPRGLSRELAARYVGVSPSTFDTLVRARQMPKPARVPSTRRLI